MIPLSGSEWGIVRFPALDVSPVKEARAPLPPVRQVGGGLGAKLVSTVMKWLVLLSPLNNC
jgi:hypothetical protein